MVNSKMAMEPLTCQNTDEGDHTDEQHFDEHDIQGLGQNLEIEANNDVDAKTEPNACLCWELVQHRVLSYLR